MKLSDLDTRKLRILRLPLKKKRLSVRTLERPFMSYPSMVNVLSMGTWSGLPPPKASLQ